MIPMSSSSSHNTSRRRSAASNVPRRRPLARSNSSLLGTIKNLVTAPLAWFATTEDFEDSPDLKGKRRRNLPPNSGSNADDSEAPRTKRARVKSPDSQIQFHPEPQYVAPAYSHPPSGYLDPPGSVFNNNSNFFRSNSVNITAPSLNQFNPNTRSGLTRTMSIDPPHNPTSFSRDAPMTFTPLDSDTSMEPSSFIRKSSSTPRDLSMPLPAARSSFRMRTSLTPQPVQPKEASEPPPLSSLAQNPVFVRPPPDSRHRLSSQSSTSTLGSLVESQRSTRSPMRQHSSLLFGSGSQTQSSEAPNTRQSAPAERALHELDIYKTPLLPTRSRLRSSPSDASFPSNISKAVDPSDMFRPRRSSQLLLMRDDRRASGLGRKSSHGFLDTEEPKEKERKTKEAKVNETKPYAGEGGLKKLLARHRKEVQEDEEEDPESQCAVEPVEDREERVIPQPLPPSAPSDWHETVSSQPASAGSSLRVGRTKTRTHIARPSRPSKKYSAAFEDEAELDEFMDDGEDLKRQRELQELEEAAKRLPAFEVPSGFSFAKEPNANPVEHDANAKEPPIAALPFSFGKPAVPAEPVVPLSVPKEAPAAIAQPKPAPPAFSFGPPSSVPEKAAEPETSAVPNFFASSKILSQVPAPSTLIPPAMPSFGATGSTPLGSPSTEVASTPKPAASVMFPSTPAPASSLTSLTPTPTPIKDNENPFWEGDGTKKSHDASVFAAQLDSGVQLTFGKVDNTSTTPSIFGGSNATSTQSVSIFGAAKKDDSHLAASSIFGASKPPTSGFSFGNPSGGEGSSVSAPTSMEPSKAEPPKPVMNFGSMNGNTSAPAETETPKAPAFPSFGQASPAADAAKPSMFGSPAPTSNPFASSAAPEAPKSTFGGFSFGAPKEPPKSEPPTASPFTFGPSTTTSATQNARKATSPAPFSFCAPLASAPASTALFSFGQGPVDTPKPTPPAGGMFAFGTPTVIAPTARPVTPPRNDGMQEFRMEESPTRDMQVNAEVKPPEPRPSLGGTGSGFSFGNPSSGSGSIFGQAAPAPAPAPFSFGTSPSPNPFAAPATENKPFGGGDFGRPSSTSNPFAFGQNNTPSSSIDPPRPSTTGSFSFQSSAPSASPGFTFGSGNQANTNPFAPLPSGGSAPSSPSTFNQPFSFGAPAPQQSGSFSFGSSQPVSPAGATSNLPQPTTPGGFGGGGFGAQPSSPFSAGGIAPPAQPAGGSLFTIGAAPPPAPASGSGPRVLKKLPRRKNN
ncbi:hypothetical protein DFH07DRAFT_472218 [Mycena maculata]|uniref:Uncharacterized protein n=1 Tax=Mycena maculata TaxID=230809 RepID=A0AAD7NDW1_9AGAR|nr:hypothetical protein DFH07DRAFT_472218 [Mycena maculata]